MAGTRGLAQFKGRQLNSGIMRNRHFDEENKIHEKYLDIDFHAHREILQDTKIDVFSQVNDKVVEGLSELDITADLNKKASTGVNVEGVVPGVRVDIRIAGTEDFPEIDEDGDRVYGRIEFVDSGDESIPDTFILKFYSEQGGIETPYTFPADADNIDFRYTLRTNLSVIPVDAIVNGGAGFVEGATDANAYMNLIQLMKDIYGATGSLDNDGNANLAKDIVTQIADEVQARKDADTEIREDLASTDSEKGADLIGVIVDADGNYTGKTVQEVLTELARTLTKNSSDLDERVSRLETKPAEEVFEAVGKETEYLLQDGNRAEEGSVLLFVNGQAQAPGINFEYIRNDDSEIIGFNFAPDTLEVVDGRPDVVYVKYNKIIELSFETGSVEGEE